jgi:hypothetical protein
LPTFISVTVGRVVAADSEGLVVFVGASAEPAGEDVAVFGEGSGDEPEVVPAEDESEVSSARATPAP